MEPSALVAPGGTLGSVGLPGDNLPAGGSDFFFFFPFKRGKIVGNYPARQGGCPSVCPSVRQLAGPLAASWQVLLVGPVCSIAGKGAPPPTGLGPQAPRSRCSGPGAWRAVSCSGSGRASPPSSAPPQAAAGTRGRCETGSGRGLSADAAGGRRASRLSLKSLLQEQGTGSGAVEETASPGGGGGGEGGSEASHTRKRLSTAAAVPWLVAREGSRVCAWPSRFQGAVRSLGKLGSALDRGLEAIPRAGIEMPDFRGPQPHLLPVLRRGASAPLPVVRRGASAPLPVVRRAESTPLPIVRQGESAPLPVVRRV